MFDYSVNVGHCVNVQGIDGVERGQGSQITLHREQTDRMRVRDEWLAPVPVLIPAPVALQHKQCGRLPNFLFNIPNPNTHSPHTFTLSEEYNKG